jgi:hypothetical protein
LSVSSDRMTSQPVMGSAMVPRMVRNPRTGAMTDSAPRQAPAIRSL